MSENISHPQYVGKAEAPKKAEFVLNPEQQQVVDVMKERGEVLENAVIDAREQASNQLKQLKGKELVDAGLKQMGHGVWETFKSQIQWVIGGGVLGGLFGAAFTAGTGQAIGRFADMADEKGLYPTNIGVGMVYGGEIGSLIGMEKAGINYNKNIAPKKNLPLTKWYDWAVSNTGILGIAALRRSPAGVITTLFNPITVGGLRNAATGLYQMATQKS